jgi:hypothetical protein
MGADIVVECVIMVQMMDEEMKGIGWMAMCAPTRYYRPDHGTLLFLLFRQPG